MDDALLVRCVERLGNLPRSRERLRDRQRPALEPLRQRAAFDELEDEDAVMPPTSSNP